MKRKSRIFVRAESFFHRKLRGPNRLTLASQTSLRQNQVPVRKRNNFTTTYCYPNVLDQKRDRIKHWCPLEAMNAPSASNGLNWRLRRQPSVRSAHDKQLPKRTGIIRIFNRNGFRAKLIQLVLRLKNRFYQLLVPK